MSRSRRTFLGLAFAISAALMVLAGIPRSQAAGDDASQILKAMSDYLASQKTISAAFDSTLEAMTPQGEKIQFNSSGTLQLQRPNEIRLTRTGGYADVELVYDGKTVSLYGNGAKSYVQADLAGNVDQVADRALMHARYAFECEITTQHGQSSCERTHCCARVAHEKLNCIVVLELSTQTCDGDGRALHVHTAAELAQCGQHHAGVI